MLFLSYHPQGLFSFQYFALLLQTLFHQSILCVPMHTPDSDVPYLVQTDLLHCKFHHTDPGSKLPDNLRYYHQFPNLHKTHQIPETVPGNNICNFVSHRSAEQLYNPHKEP